ncbi:MAG: aminotransferase class III-fold pyridoxal phosphate-dependent enzyme [Candidatus Riflebacteria bacterium]|nr:aminotransferase class III-fold pyridoxal phosphate-dependent enzyme [Candidatus Riflebacteria bacterium]
MDSNEGDSRAALYEQFARPELARLLAALRLDVAYTRGQGDTLAFDDGRGEETVLDLLGGYGACLFGHNHPEIVAVARTMLDSLTPVHAQASLRTGAGELARALSDQVRAWAGEECVTTLTNSGAEAIEAAIKMAQLERATRFSKLADSVARRCHQIRRRVQEGTCRIPDRFYRRLAAVCETPAIRGLDEALFHWNRVVRDRIGRPPVFLALEGAFHGKTCGAVQLTHNEEYRAPFTGLGFPVVFLPSGDQTALTRAVEQHRFDYPELEIDPANVLTVSMRRSCNVAAMFVEPVQGEGGIRVLDRQYARAIRDHSDRVGFPIVADEIQCGLGRTGSFLASQEVGLAAHYWTFSKSLGGGLAKIGALTLVRSRQVADFSLLHSSTFAEDEPSCRIALKALEIATRDRSALARGCRDKGRFLLERLKEVKERHPTVIREVRGLGLMVGFQLDRHAGAGSGLIASLAGQGLLGHLVAGWFLHEERIRVGRTLSDPNTIRLEPSAFVTQADLERFLQALDRLCEVLEKANMYELVKFMVGLETTGSRAPVADFSQTRPPTPIPRFARRVGFLCHYIAAEHMVLREPSLAAMTPEKLEEFARTACRVLDPILYDQFLVRSDTGDLTSIAIIGYSFTSRTVSESLIDHDVEWLQEKIEAGVRLAREIGCTVVGFGGYTSIVTNNCRNVREGGIALTTGNSLTTAFGIEATVGECDRVGIDLGSARLAALGAAGNICSTYAAILAETVPEVVLIGRPGTEDRLRHVGAEIYFEAYKALKAAPDACHRGVAAAARTTRTMLRALASVKGVARIGEWIFDGLAEELGGDRFVRIATDLSALADANVIVAASNTAEPLIFPRHLGRGPIVICDIAVPANVSPEVVRARSDVHVIQGGIVQLPQGQGLVIPGVPLENGQVFACMAETMLLGLTGIGQDFSCGNISKIQVKRIAELARIHGFTLARVKVEPSM